MKTNLQGRKVAFLATDGVNEAELVQPRDAFTNAGAEVHLISIKEGEIQSMNSLDKGKTYPVDLVVDRASSSDYLGLVLPGGVANPDHLRMDRTAVAFIRDFFEQGKPVAAICHAPWTLVEADVLRGRKITSYPSLQTDIRNAGGTWVDEEVVVDQGLVSSRRPDDLPAFCAKLVEEICEGTHEGQRQSVGSAS